MKRQEKIDTVAELSEAFGKAASLVLADYRGLTVEQVNGLRSEIRKAACTYRVVKNTLAKRAIEGTPMEPLAEYFRGPTAVAYSFEDPVSPAKILDKFAEDHQQLELKAAYLDGEVLGPKKVQRLAQMKGTDELRAELLMLMLAPAQGLVRLLAAGPQNFLYLMQARKRGLEG
jgi:large subunit ribosomal protein L10